MAATVENNPLVIDVPAELFAPAESSSFEGTYDMGEFDFGPDHYQTVGTMQWNAFVSNVGGALLVTGSITGVVATECSRCLDDSRNAGCEWCALRRILLFRANREAPEDMDEDEFDYLPESNQLDFEPILRAAVLVDLPYVPLCAEDCKGLCPQCGANLNDGPCGCKPVEDDVVRTDSGKPSQFAALKNFKFGSERRTRKRSFFHMRLCWRFGRAVLPCGGFPKATAGSRSLRSLCARLASFSF